MLDGPELPSTPVVTAGIKPTAETLRYDTMPIMDVVEEMLSAIPGDKRPGDCHSLIDRGKVYQRLHEEKGLMQPEIGRVFGITGSAVCATNTKYRKYLRAKTGEVKGSLPSRLTTKTVKVDKLPGVERNRADGIKDRQALVDDLKACGGFPATYDNMEFLRAQLRDMHLVLAAKV